MAAESGQVERAGHPDRRARRTWSNLIGGPVLEEKKKRVSEMVYFTNESVARPHTLAFGSKRSNGHTWTSSKSERKVTWLDVLTR